jgi:hypothetical protein
MLTVANNATRLFMFLFPWDSVAVQMVFAIEDYVRYRDRNEAATGCGTKYWRIGPDVS